MNNPKTKTGIILLQLLMSSCNNSHTIDDTMHKGLKSDTTHIINDSIKEVISSSAGNEAINGMSNQWILVLLGIAIIISLYAIYTSFANNYKLNHCNNDICRYPSTYQENHYKELITEISLLKNKITTLENLLRKQHPEQYVSASGESKTKPSLKKNVTSTPTDSVKPNQQEMILTNQNEAHKFIWLKAVDGAKLTNAQSADAAMYKAWKSNGLYAFEFCYAKTEKAINNRTSLIEPFCEIDSSGVEPDQAKNVIVKKPGTLSEDFQVITKVLIQYC